MTAGAIAAGGVSGLGALVLRTPGYAAAADVVDVTLVAQPYVFSPAAGVVLRGLAYNRQVPGPFLRLHKGQRLRARLVNRSGEPTTIHWHGMVLPNLYDGVPDVTQAPVADGGEFVYDFTPAPAGTRWYHSHAMGQSTRGLFGAVVIDDPSEDVADHDVMLVFHDVADMRSWRAALADTSNAMMDDPTGSPEITGMRMDQMGDEVAYRAHCINGACYPRTQPLVVSVGQRVRLRILNASPTQTRYVRLAEHALRLTHSDGNRLFQPVDVDVLRIGAAERYDAWFEVTRPGAWLLQSISASPFAFEQALVVRTSGSSATPVASPMTVSNLQSSTYEFVGGARVAASHDYGRIDVRQHFELGGGAFGVPRWTINDKVWPDAPRVDVHRGDRVLVTMTNHSDMDHPMHLHGHIFAVVGVNYRQLDRPLLRDTALVPGNGGTLAMLFEANSPPGRWLLHCHNAVHEADGMATEVRYV